MKRSWITKLLIVSLCGATMTTQTACIGSFALTTGLLSWNQSLGNKFINWLVFLAFNIIPIYGIAVFIDAFIFNSMEFWTGSNPMAENAEKERRVVVNDDFELHFKRISAQEMTVSILENGEHRQTVSMAMDANGLILRDTDGSVIARVEEHGETVTVYDARGEILSTHTQAESDEISEAYRKSGASGVLEIIEREGHPEVSESLAIR